MNGHKEAFVGNLILKNSIEIQYIDMYFCIVYFMMNANSNNATTMHSYSNHIFKRKNKVRVTLN